MIRKSIFYCQIIFVYCLLYSLHAQERHFSVDVKEIYQTIDNFGASDCWSMQKIGDWVPTQKERVADLLFSTETGIGLTAWRFNIGAGINFATIRHPWRTVETFEDFRLHIEFKPPAKEGVCDQCGGELYQRDDDQETAIRERLAVYRRQTQPLIDYYRGQGTLKEIDGLGAIGEIQERILGALGVK